MKTSTKYGFGIAKMKKILEMFYELNIYATLHEGLYHLCPFLWVHRESNNVIKLFISYSLSSEYP